MKKLFSIFLVILTIGACSVVDGFYDSTERLEQLQRDVKIARVKMEQLGLLLVESEKLDQHYQILDVLQEAVIAGNYEYVKREILAEYAAARETIQVIYAARELPVPNLLIKIDEQVIQFWETYATDTNFEYAQALIESIKLIAKIAPMFLSEAELKAAGYVYHAPRGVQTWNN